MKVTSTKRRYRRIFRGSGSVIASLVALLVVVALVISNKEDNQLLLTKLHQDHNAEKVSLEDFESCKKSIVTRPQSSYGAWTFCESAVTKLSRRPTVVSFGIGEDMNFEMHMIEHYNASVFAHDPTPKSINYVKNMQQKHPFLNDPSRFVFSPVGLAAKDQSNVEMDLPSNPDHVSARVGKSVSKIENSAGSFFANLISMKTAMAKQHLHQVDVAKWDVEGSEFEILEQTDEFPYKLLLLEWHERFFPGSKGLDRRNKITEKLKFLGFVSMHLSANKQEEFFFNTRYGH